MQLNSKSLVNQKLVVQPIFSCLLHKEVFMGPCRYGSEDQLTYEYDKKSSLETLEIFKEDLAKYVDLDFVEIKEPISFEWHEDFAIKDAPFEKIAESAPAADIFLVSGTRLISYVSSLIAKRLNKPIAFCPLSNSNYSRLGGIDATAYLKALGYKEMYNALNYTELNQFFRALKVRKALSHTKAMYGLRNNVISFGAVSSFVDLNDFEKKLGMEVFHFSGPEFFKVMDELTVEEQAKAQQIADDLANEAEANHMPVKYYVNDVKFYLAVNKVMDHYDCNAFTLPCFEMCATKELNRRKLTFCLTHSLLKDEGVPSACASDVNSLACYQILMNLAKKCPTMGNCMVRVKDLENNTMRILHDVPGRYMKGYDREPEKVSYASFTMNSWGTTMRLDYAKDIGKKITLINLSPRLDKIMIAKGEIIGCDDFVTPECRLACVFKVKDAKGFHEKEEDFGHHYCWVYGDYTEDLEKVAKVLHMQAVLAE